MKAFLQKTVFGPNYRWYAVSIVSLAVLISTTEVGLISISLPEIMAYFKADMALAAWIALINSLVTASLFLPVGRLADMFGFKGMLIAGFLCTAAGSALAGLSQTPEQLIFFRIIQAIGNALMMSNSFAITTALFPPEERGRALGVSGGTFSAFGFMIGPSLGGFLVYTLGWRAVFFINVPGGLFGFLLTLLLLKEQRMYLPNKKKKEPFDFLGAAIFSLGLTTLLMGLTTVQRASWNSPLVITELSVAIASLLFFIWWESHIKYPLLDLKLFSIRLFVAGNGARLVSFMTQAINSLLMPFYLQLALGMNPLKAGLVMTPNALALIFISPLSGWLSDRIGARLLCSLGLAINSVGFFLLSTLSSGADYLDVLKRLIFLAVGLGLFQTPNNSIVMGSVPQGRLGVASAFLSVIRSVGNSLGIVIATTLVTSSLIAIAGQTSLFSLKQAGSLGENSALLRAFIQGFKYSYIAAGFSCILGVIVSLARGPRQETNSNLQNRSSG